MSTRPEAPAVRSETGFAVAFGLGLLVPVVAAMIAGFAGGNAYVGLAAAVLLGGGILSRGPLTSGRVAGVVAGAATTVAACFGLLFMILANADL